MEIGVGEYIRTKEGIIRKVEYVEGISKPYVIKHSKNIIDLIEVGDIVTYWLGVGYYTTRTVSVDFLKQIKDTFINKDIRSIVTKEQFKEMEYRV